MKTKIIGMPWLWIRRLHAVKISVVPKMIYKCNVISIKIPADCFVETDKLILM